MTTEQLIKLYYNPEMGLLSKEKFAQKASEIFGITKVAARKFAESQNVDQIYTQKRKEYGQIFAPGPGRLVMDLIDMSNQSRQNHGYKWLQSIIDMHSRRVWVFPLKTKKPEDVLPGLRTAFNDVDDNPRTIKEDVSLTTDAGSEYKGVVARYLNDKKIQHFVGNPSDGTDRRTAHIESFNRTILNYIKRLWTATGKLNWVDSLQKLADNYNSTRHRIIKAKPIDIWNGTKKSAERKKQITYDDLQIGDYVRVRLPVDNFKKKGREQVWSTVVYKIIDREGMRYMIINSNDENALERTPLKTLYYPRDLLKVTKTKNDNIGQLAEYSKITTENKIAKRVKTRQHKDFNKGAVGHEVKEITDEGEVVYKERLRPGREKREIKKPNRLDL